MRSQWCREHIDEAAEKCGLGVDTVSDVKKAAKFCATASEFSDCSTAAICALISIRDDPVRDKAILSVSNALKSGKHPLTGEFLKDKRLPEKTIKKVIRKVEMEVRGELTEKYKEEKQAGPEKEPEKDRVADASKSITEEAPAVPAQPSLAAQVAGTVPPEPPIHRPPPCLGGGGCERGKFRSDKVRGNVCDAIGAPINQLPGNMCPYDIKLARKSESAFVPASQLATANKDPGIPGGKPAIPDRTLTITFSPSQWVILGKLQTAGVADGYDGAVLFCVDEIGNRST